MECAQPLSQRLIGPIRVALYYLSLALFYLMVWIFNGFCFICQVCPNGPSKERFIRTCLHHWTRLYLAFLRLTGNLAIDYVDFESFSQLRGTIIIGNHPTLLDAFLVFAQSPHLICVYKSALHGRLITKTTGKACGFIANDCGREAIQNARKKLASGHNILIFPEGTRTAHWPITPLTRGYALIAKSQAAPIRLITIETRTNALTKRRSYLNPPCLPVHYHLRLSPEINPTDFPTTNALNASIENQFSTSLATTYTSEFAFPIDLISRDAERALYRVSVPPSPSFCRDHFPNRPLLPAYAILLFVRYALRQTLDLAPAHWSWQQLKFIQPILPNAQLTLEIQPKQTSIQIKLREQGAICFSGRFVADCALRA